MTRRRSHQVDGRILRRARGELTLQQVADRVGISKTFLSRLENGQRSTVTQATAEALAHHLGVPVELFTEKEDVA